MRRREFIRNTAIYSASTFLLPAIGKAAGSQGERGFRPLASLQLTDFDDEQDECPILFQNRTDSFLATLRRKEYPSDKETISLFKWDAGVWKEQESVTAAEGSYEAVSADCHHDGVPAVAWTEIEGDRWTIKATVRSSGGFPEAVRISDPAKRSINPVVKASGPKAFVIACESFEKGRFCIYQARFDGRSWSKPRLVTDKSRQCFDPAIAVGDDGRVYIAYDVSDGPHRNIEMKVFESGRSLKQYRSRSAGHLRTG